MGSGGSTVQGGGSSHGLVGLVDLLTSACKHCVANRALARPFEREVR